ncbi:hypothetical protein [Actinoplanes sp. NPDC049265]|uniref:hypothetical protein n=1 Tax=Actinoplanes sp. NPDC049265 TaxID=3363902 RepID=UPI00371290D5
MAVAVACVLALAAAWHTSGAAFTDTTATTADWRAGSVALSGTPATAVISASGAIPGSFGSTCVVVAYTGTLDARVRLYLRPADITGTGLASYLTLQISEGTGSSASCTDFATTGTLWNPAGVPAFAAASHDYATGVSNWLATPAASRTYRIDWQLQDDNAAQNLTAAVTFTWEAQQL